MKTDKQVYKIFSANPRWLFEITGRPWLGPCLWKSVTFKELQQSSDGVIEPDDVSQPLIVAEVQGYYDQFIYARIALEMAMLQREADNRCVQGVILFFEERLDPRTEPWTKVVDAFYLDQTLAELAMREPAHPLVAVFRPVMQVDTKTLGKNAAVYYNQIRVSKLPRPTVDKLLDVFLDWLAQRFPDFGKKEQEGD